MEEGLNSSYIVLEDDENRVEEEDRKEKESVVKTAASKIERVDKTEENTAGTHQKEESSNNTFNINRKRKYTQDTSIIKDSRYINILTPKKEKSLIFLTPVKRTRRSVITGIKSGDIKVCNSTLEIRNNENEKYVSLVECFKKLEKLERMERRNSIDKIVEKYLEKREQ